jgi:hypothetical protein
MYRRIKKRRTIQELRRKTLHYHLSGNMFAYISAFN